MNVEDIDHLCGLLKARLGIVLTRDKAYLLQSRLGSIARERGYADSAELLAELRRGPLNAALLQQVSDAMTTNESFFFRDVKPFEHLRDIVLPRLVEARGGRRQLRIWSAACSSGQEPYSIAIVLKEMAARLDGWRIDILATDVSSRMIARASAGEYTDFEVKRGLPEPFRNRYFEKKGDAWQIDPALRSMVTFRPFNLLHSAAQFGAFDVVYCRNVLIYFDQVDKARVLTSIRNQMTEGGYLFLGGAETVFGLSDAFEPLTEARGVYAALPRAELATAAEA